MLRRVVYKWMLTRYILDREEGGGFAGEGYPSLAQALGQGPGFGKGLEAQLLRQKPAKLRVLAQGLVRLAQGGKKPHHL